MNTPPPAMLEIDNLHAGYGAADIINGVSLRVDAGEMVVVAGPNGAGKSTVIRAVFGLARVTGGSIRFQGENITRLRTDKIVSRGICYTPQVANVFPGLSVDENLDMGGFLLRRGLAAAKARLYERFPLLTTHGGTPAGALSGGQRQLVAIGRAMMPDPRLLVLDEPTAGLSPKNSKFILQFVRELADGGIAVLMVEQNVRHALPHADRGYVLITGRNRLEDSGPRLLANPELGRIFLGGGD